MSAKKKLSLLDTIEELEYITAAPGVNLRYEGSSYYDVNSGQPLRNCLKSSFSLAEVLGSYALRLEKSLLGFFNKDFSDAF
jgi:hypothetical protein